MSEFQLEMLNCKYLAALVYLLKIRVCTVASSFFFFKFLYLFPLSRLPGDSRTKIGFITFDSTIHFYNLQEGLSQPQMLIVSDIEGEVQLKADRAVTSAQSSAAEHINII